MREPFIVTPDRRTAVLNVFGNDITVLASETDTRDVQVSLQSGRDRLGAPPHSHPWDELFYVTSGRVEFGFGEGGARKVTCDAGTLLHIPAGTIHSFTYSLEGGEMLEVTGKGSHAVAMFVDLAREIPPEVPEPAKVGEVLGRHGLTVHK